MLVKRGDIVYRSILFKRYLRNSIKFLPGDICNKCIYHSRYCYCCMKFPINVLGGPEQNCRLFDTWRFIYIPRGFVSKKI